MQNDTKANLRAIWGSTDAGLFAVGSGGTILRLQAGVWQPLNSGTPATLYGIWCSFDTSVYAVGESGVSLRFQNGGWIPMSSSTGANLYGIWGGSSGVFVAGSKAYMLRLNEAPPNPALPGEQK